MFHLEDVYWEDEGRQSVVATVLGAAVIVLMLVVTAPSGLHSDTFSDRSRIVALLYLGGNALFALICFLKGKPFVGLTAIFIPFVGLVGATRLAHARSPWAHVFYDQVKLERARESVLTLPGTAGSAIASSPSSAVSRIARRTIPESSPPRSGIFRPTEHAQDDPEHQVAERRLGERPARPRHRRQLGCTAGRVPPVDEKRQRVGDQVLDQRETDREPEGIALRSTRTAPRRRCRRSRR